MKGKEDAGEHVRDLKLTVRGVADARKRMCVLREQNQALCSYEVVGSNQFVAVGDEFRCFLY